MVSEDLARRFLHVNLNCGSLEATERFYAGVLGLSPRMRTDPEVPTNGAILGMDDETYCADIVSLRFARGQGRLRARSDRVSESRPQA